MERLQSSGSFDAGYRISTASIGRGTLCAVCGCIRGNEGRFVPPSLGGNPTRGNVALLPTGRNFYASDPSQIPSRAAWEIGQQLAAQMLKHYQEEEGGYPVGGCSQDDEPRLQRPLRYFDRAIVDEGSSSANCPEHFL